MKRVLSVLFTIVICIGLTGCAQEISGSVSTVYEACKELPTDANARVTVTGEQAEYFDVERSNDYSVVSFWLSDDGSLGYMVVCLFENPSDDTLEELRSFGRKTITGDFDDINSSYVTLRNCSLH